MNGEGARRRDVTVADVAKAAQVSKAQAARALLDAGADVNAPVAKGGYTPLMLASISGSNELATSLIDHGAARAVKRGVPPERIVTTWPLERLRAWTGRSRDAGGSAGF